MPQPPQQSEYLSFWIQGCNSMLHPSALPQGQYAWSENCAHRGGVVQTRPGMRYMAPIPGSKAQGFCMFTPAGQIPVMIAVVDGIIYSARYPYKQFAAEASALVMDKRATITFCVTLQSVKRSQSGTEELITPTNILIVQDGTNTRSIGTAVHGPFPSPIPRTQESPSEPGWRGAVRGYGLRRAIESSPPTLEIQFPSSRTPISPSVPHLTLATHAPD